MDPNEKDELNDSTDSYEILNAKNASVVVAKNVAWMTLITVLFGAGISLIDIAGIDYGHYAKELDNNA